MKICIVCQKEVGPAARPVKEDPAIRFIRRFKQIAGIARNNDLYVCEADLETHAKRRKSFEGNLLVSALLGAGFVLILVILPLLAGRLDFFGVISSLFIGALIVLMVVFFRYTPAVEDQPAVSLDRPDPAETVKSPVAASPEKSEKPKSKKGGRSYA